MRLTVQDMKELDRLYSMRGLRSWIENKLKNNVGPVSLANVDSGLYYDVYLNSLYRALGNYRVNMDLMAYSAMDTPLKELDDEDTLFVRLPLNRREYNLKRNVSAAQYGDLQRSKSVKFDPYPIVDFRRSEPFELDPYPLADITNVNVNDRYRN